MAQLVDKCIEVKFSPSRWRTTERPDELWKRLVKMKKFELRSKAKKYFQKNYFERQMYVNT